MPRITETTRAKEAARLEAQRRRNAAESRAHRGDQPGPAPARPPGTPGRRVGAGGRLQSALAHRRRLFPLWRRATPVRALDAHDHHTACLVVRVGTTPDHRHPLSGLRPGRRLPGGLRTRRRGRGFVLFGAGTTSQRPRTGALATPDVDLGRTCPGRPGRRQSRPRASRRAFRLATQAVDRIDFGPVPELPPAPRPATPEPRRIAEGCAVFGTAEIDTGFPGFVRIDAAQFGLDRRAARSWPPGVVNAGPTTTTPPPTTRQRTRPTASAPGSPSRSGIASSGLAPPGRAATGS